MTQNLKVIIPAAGKGMRFSPFTSVVPKELLPIMQYPAIEFIVKESAYAKATADKYTHDSKLIFIIHEGKEAITEYVKIRFPEQKINIVYQKEALGLGHAVLQAADFFTKPDKSFLLNKFYFGEKPTFKDTKTNKNIPQPEFVGIMLPDDIFFAKIPVLQQLQNIAEKYNASVIAIKEVEKESVSSYGIINIESTIEENVFLIKEVVEKPEIEKAPSHYAIIGRYILDTQIFEFLKQIKPGAKGEYQLTDAISLLINSGKPVLAILFEGDHFDIGTPSGWLKAVNFYAQHLNK